MPPMRLAAVETGPAPAIVGREAELASVARLLSIHRLVTIAGPGGMGKTRLAGELARAATARGGRPHWVDLGAITQPEKIAPAIANAAGLPLGEGSPGPLLARALMAGETILFLDNCEHLAREVAALVHHILEGAAGVRVVATSQEALHVAGEHVFRLEALALPPEGASLAEARTFAGIQLLEQRAMAADARFTLGEDSIPHAIAICRNLDGIPLAIEMAAARLPVLGAKALLERLDERMKLLKAATRQAPARQQTLQATLDWSHSLLSESERVTFRRLGAFVGSFRLELAQRVAGWGDLDEWSALDALMGLADKSLLQVEGHGPPRYRLLESARVYALAELGRHGELEQTLAYHGDAMAAFAEAAGNTYWQMAESPSPARWYPDYDDLHAAWDRAADRGDPVVMAGTSRLLSILDFERNVYSTVRRRKEAAWRVLGSAGPRERALLYLVICLFRLIQLPELPRVRASEDRVSAWRALGDRRQVHFALSRLATDYAIEGRVVESRATLAEALALDDPSWTPHFRWFLPFAAKNAAGYLAEPKEMRRWANDMLDLAHRAKSPARIAESRVACAEAALAGGDATEAVRLATAAAAECRSLEQPLNLFEALTVHSAAQLRMREAHAARASAIEALSLPWQIEVAITFFDQVAHLAAMEGRFESAARLFGFADRGYELTQDRRRTHGAAAETAGAALIERAVGRESHLRLRKEGTLLPEVRAESLARECLGC
jgi:predicted ATPase